MNKKQFFVAGTDTGVGKTKISCALLLAAKQLQLSTCGIKPIASGCELIDGLWRNEDALALQQVATYRLDYQTINPVALPEAIAPHLAAKANNQNLSVQPLVQHCQDIAALPIDFTIIEGAGGWLVPLNDQETLADFVAAMALPVILVVGIRLGCINHALLTVQAIAAMGLTLSGWVANCIDHNTDNSEDIIESLRIRIKAPCFGAVPFIAGHIENNDISHYLNLSTIL